MKHRGNSDGAEGLVPGTEEAPPPLAARRGETGEFPQQKEPEEHKDAASQDHTKSSVRRSKSPALYLALRKDAEFWRDVEQLQQLLLAKQMKADIKRRIVDTRNPPENTKGEDGGHCCKDPPGKPSSDLEEAKNETAQPTAQQTWSDDADAFVLLTQAMAILHNGPDVPTIPALSTFSRKLTPDGPIRYMRKAPRCKVHVQDFLKHWVPRLRSRCDPKDRDVIAEAYDQRLADGAGDRRGGGSSRK
jgi:hypothetical protein